MSFASTDAQRTAFIAFVTRHALNDLPPEEWVWLRERAQDQLSGVVPWPDVDVNVAPTELIAKNICEDSGPTSEEIISTLKATARTIAHIDGNPVYYLERTGIYVWDIPSSQGLSLSFWISFPAYPPGW